MTEYEAMDVVKIVSDLVAAVNTLKLYTPTHPQMSIFVDRLCESLAHYFATDSELTLLIIENDIVVDKKPLSNVATVGHAYVNLMRKKGIERLTFLSGLQKDQLMLFLVDLAAQDVTRIPAHSHIRLGRIAMAGKSEAADHSGGSDVEEGGTETFLASVTQDLKSIYTGVQTDQFIDPVEAKGMAVDFIKTFNQSINPLKYLASIKSEDEYTYVHTINVALLTTSLASYLGFSGKQLVDITFAALMHDVGKMLIPDEILNKPGALNDKELEIMQTHPIRGAQYIGQQKNMPRITMLAALEHHIKYDGSGYPRVGTSWRPHIVSQMISVCDIYDALRSRRPYREPLHHDKITQILRKDAGTALNPALVESFIAMISQ